MLYIITFAVGVFLGAVIVARDTQEQEAEFRVAWGMQAAELDELHAINECLCARLDGRSVTLYDEDGMAVEMPAEAT